MRFILIWIIWEAVLPAIPLPHENIGWAGGCAGHKR